MSRNGLLDVGGSTSVEPRAKRYKPPWTLADIGCRFVSVKIHNGSTDAHEITLFGFFS